MSEILQQICRRLLGLTNTRCSRVTALRVMQGKADCVLRRADKQMGLCALVL